MKYIIFFLLLCSVSVQAQRIGTANSTVYVPGNFRLPLDTLASAPTGSVAYKNGVVYYKTTSWIAIGGGGGGSVNSFSSGNLSPLFTTNVADPTTDPALSFTLSNAPSGTLFGRQNGTSGVPSYLNMDSLFGFYAQPITVGIGDYSVEDSTNTPPVSFPAGVDTTYWMVGGAGTGIFSGNNYKIALYVNGVFDSFITPVSGDYANTLDDGVNHRYDGATWPITYTRPWNQAGNVPGGRLGSTAPNRTDFIYNGNVKLRIGGNVVFPQLTGTPIALAQIGPTGILLRTEPASSSDTTTNKPLGMAADGTIVKLSYWPGSGGGSSQGIDDVLAFDPDLTADRTMGFTGFTYGMDGTALNVNIADTARYASVGTTTHTAIANWIAQAGDTLKLQGTVATLKGSSKAWVGFNTGTGDSTGWEAKTGLLRFVGGQFSANAANKSALVDTITGALSWGDPFTLTTTGSGAASYNTGTKVLNIPTPASNVAGSSTQIQFNTSGAFDASANYTYNGTAQTIFNNGIASTATAGQIFSNTTAATVGTTVQEPGSIEFNGAAWKSAVTAASQTQAGRIEFKPVTGTSGTGAVFNFGFNDNGGGFTNLVTMTRAAGGSTATLFASTLSGTTVTASGYGSAASLAGTLFIEQKVTGSTWRTGRFNTTSPNLQLQNGGTFSTVYALLHMSRVTAALGSNSVSTTSGANTMTFSGVELDCRNTFKIGDQITINGETKTIATIPTALSMTATTNFSNTNSGVTFTKPALEVAAFRENGLIGFGTTSPAAFLDIAQAGTVDWAPLKFTAGTDLTTGVDGAMNWDGSDLKIWDGTTKYVIDKSLTGSATLDFASTGAGAVADLTITVTGAADGDVVDLGVPNGSITATSSFTAWVSAANTVTVRFSPKATEDPASGTFKVRVTK